MGFSEIDGPLLGRRGYCTGSAQLGSFESIGRSLGSLQHGLFCLADKQGMIVRNCGKLLRFPWGFGAHYELKHIVCVCEVVPQAAVMYRF